MEDLVQQNALNYLSELQKILGEQSKEYKAFFDVMSDHQSHGNDVLTTQRMLDLFKGHTELTDGFNKFLSNSCGQKPPLEIVIPEQTLAQAAIKEENKNTIVVHPEPKFVHKNVGERSVYKCNYCVQNGSKANMQKHQKSCDSREVLCDYLMYCGGCKTAFEYYRAFTEHFDENPNCQLLRDKQFACRVCHYIFTKKRSLDTHTKNESHDAGKASKHAKDCKKEIVQIITSWMYRAQSDESAEAVSAIEESAIGSCASVEQGVGVEDNAESIPPTKIIRLTEPVKPIDNIRRSSVDNICTMAKPNQQGPAIDVDNIRTFDIVMANITESLDDICDRLQKPISIKMNVTHHRIVYLDACNIAYCKSNQTYKRFNMNKLLIVIKFFEDKGHQVIAVAPCWRREKNTDQASFESLLLKNKMVLTPNRVYDDLVLVQLAAQTDGVVVSRDKFSDVLFKIKDFTHAEWRIVNEMRVDFVWSKNGTQDIFQTIIDPNGRDGLKLHKMLMRSEISPSSQQLIEPSIDAYSRNTDWLDKYIKETKDVNQEYDVDDSKLFGRFLYNNGVDVAKHT